MPFRADQFVSAPLALRTRAVPVADLLDWFDGEPVWTVRGLTANEIAKVDQSERALKTAHSLAQALASGAAREVTEHVRDLLGRSDAIESIYARQIEILVQGSVEPKIDHAIAAKLGETFPVVFKHLVQTILELTGLGADAEKKPLASSKTVESKPLSGSE